MLDFNYMGTFAPRSSYKDLGASFTKVGDCYVAGCPRYGNAVGEVFRFRRIGNWLKHIGEYNAGYQGTQGYEGYRLASAVYDSGYDQGFNLYMSNPRSGLTSYYGALVRNTDTMYDKWNFYRGSGTAITGASLGGVSSTFPADVSAWTYGFHHVQFCGAKPGSTLFVFQQLNSFSTSNLIGTFDITLGAPGVTSSLGYKVKMTGNDILVSRERIMGNPGAYVICSWDGNSWVSNVQTLTTTETQVNFGTDIEFDTVVDRLYVSDVDNFIYMYEHNGSAWIEISKLSPPTDWSSGDNWGDNIFAYNNLLFVGAPLHTLNAGGTTPITGAGAVYIYTVDPTTGSFNLLKKLVSADRQFNYYFGKEDIFFDGDILIVGELRGGASGDGRAHWWTYEDLDLIPTTSLLQIVSY